MSTPLFSISVICKNEEDSLPNLHASLKNYIEAGGEVVFVDTGSTDKTIEVLKKLGYKSEGYKQLRYIEVGTKFVIDLSNEIDKINEEFIDSQDTPFTSENVKLSVFDFCTARRFAGKMCPKNYVLSVDCDEVFSALDVEAINTLILTKQFNQFSFTFRYRDTNGNISSVTSRDKLYDKTQADWKWLVHEQVKPLEGFMQRLTNLPENVLAIDHYQHPAEHRSNYLLSMCVDVMKDPNDQHVFWLGRELHFRNYHRSAIKLLEKYLKEYNGAWSAEKCMAAVYIGDAYIDISKKEEGEERKIYERYALMNYFLGTLYEKTFREPWLRLGYYYVSKAEHELATTFISVALNIKTVNRNYMNDVNYCYGPEPFMKMYVSLYAIGSRVRSYEVWSKAKEFFPDHQGIADHQILFKCIM